MKNVFLKRAELNSPIYLFVLVVVLSLTSCKKENLLSRDNSSLSSDNTADKTTDSKPENGSDHEKSLPIGATIKSVYVTESLNQVGYGFPTDARYFSRDFNGDGIGDVLRIDQSSNAYLHLGEPEKDPYTSGWPDKVGDDMGGVKYLVSEGFYLGSGFNHIRYFVADFTGDGKSDILAQSSDGKIWLFESYGTGFYSAAQQVRAAQAAAWSLTDKFVPVDSNGDGKYELLQIGSLGSTGSFQKTWSKGSGSTWSPYGTQNYPTAMTFDKNDDFYPVNIDGDGDVDLFIRKANGNLYYSKNNGLSLGFSTPQQCGNGWNYFTDVYAGYHWSCWTPIASLTGVRTNGDLYTYKWNSSSNSFSSGVKVGNGWNYFATVLTGNYIPDISSRYDFLGIKNDGKMYAYCTLAILN